MLLIAPYVFLLKMTNSFKIAFVVGEVSGDDLAADLLPTLRNYIESKNLKLELLGLGGERLKSQGLNSLFDISEISVMGLSAVLPRIPQLLSRIRETANYIANANPDLVLLVDSPDYCHRVASRIRNINSKIPIYQYVCPSVWAWRSYRAKRMNTYIDHIFSILPFESDALKKLGGPSSTYVGHPLSHISVSVRPLPDIPTLLLLPGSRRSEVERHLPLFHKTLNLLSSEDCQFNLVLPAVPHLHDYIQSQIANWNFSVKIVDSTNNETTFTNSHLALASSGTVSLQLALYKVPMVIAYKLDIFARLLSPFLRNTWSVVLPNLIAGSFIVPEHIAGDAIPHTLSQSLKPLLCETPQRKKQLKGFDVVAKRMKTKKSSAEIIIETLKPIIDKN